MLLDGVISLLVADPATAALIAGRAYQSVLPRGYLLPAIAVHRYGATQDYDFAGPVSVREDQVQVDAYGATAADAQNVIAAVRAALTNFTGTLPDGTVVQAIYLEREQDLPFLPHADSKGLANRSLIAVRVVSKQ